MSKKRTKSRYRRLRTDHRHHPKLEGMSMLARDIMFQAIEATPLGVLEASQAKIAMESGPLVPGGRLPSDRQVRAAIKELVDRGIALWWPRLETLWVVEAADEQVMNQHMWEGLGPDISRLPHAVRSTILARYPRETVGAVADGVRVDAAQHSGGDSGGTHSPPTLGVHLSVQKQKQEQIPGAEAGADPPPRLPPADPDGKIRTGVRLTPNAWASEFAYRLRESPHHATVQQSPFAVSQAAEGIQRALDAYGPETVEAVVLHALEQAARHVETDGATGIPPGWYAKIFVRDGFGARLQAYLDDQRAPESGPSAELLAALASRSVIYELEGEP